MRNGTASALALLFVVSLLSACEDKITPGGCPTYSHIVSDRVDVHIDDDSISLFLCAEEYYAAPVGCVHEISGDLSDSLVVMIFGYGRSSEPEPDPYLAYHWRSDSLMIWYSARPAGMAPIGGDGGLMRRTPPCIPAFYKVDYILLRHSADLEVVFDGKVRSEY